MLITDVISEYIFDCEIRKFSLKTIRGYRNNLLYLEKYLKGYDITRIEEIKTIHLKSFFKHISDSGRKESYMNGLLKTFRAFFKYAVSEEYISVNPCLKVPWAKEAMPLITTFTDAEVKRMIYAFKETDYMEMRNNGRSKAYSSDPCVLS